MLMLYALKASVTSQGRNEQGDKTNKKLFYDSWVSCKKVTKIMHSTNVTHVKQS